MEQAVNSPADNLQFDPSRRRVTRNGRPIKLQDKAARVLTMIAARSPHTVSRSELIDEIWAGNYLVGERGLNQALWAIRAELGDNARNPVYIKTLPREGYRWLIAPKHDRRFVSVASVAASACIISLAVAILPVTAPADVRPEYALPAKCAIANKGDVHAYKINRNVLVDIQDGCRLIVKPSGTKEFGSPMLSDDGKHVAFTVTEERSCRFVTVAIQEGQHTEYDSC